MYERIVVGTDGSERADRAVDRAVALARLTGAELHLVQGCGTALAVGVGTPQVAPIDPSDVTEACSDALEAIAAPIRDAGVIVHTDALSLNGHAALCHTAERVDADLIVVGNRGMTGKGRFLGSVPNSVSHQAPCSVLIVETS